MQKITDTGNIIRYKFDIKECVFVVSLIKINDYYDLSFDSNVKKKGWKMKYNDIQFLLKTLSEITQYEIKDKRIKNIIIKFYNRVRFRIFKNFIENLKTDLNLEIKFENDQIKIHVINI